MTTQLHMKCDGCFVEAYTPRFKKTFESASGRSYGFGSWRQPDIDEVVSPTGWVWSDPYTSCTYCPECWKQVSADPLMECPSPSHELASQHAAASETPGVEAVNSES